MVASSRAVSMRSGLDALGRRPRRGGGRRPAPTFGSAASSEAGPPHASGSSSSRLSHRALHAVLGAADAVEQHLEAGLHEALVRRVEPFGIQHVVDHRHDQHARDVGDAGRIEVAAQIARGDAALDRVDQARAPFVRVLPHRRARADEAHHQRVELIERTHQRVAPRVGQRGAHHAGEPIDHRAACREVLVDAADARPLGRACARAALRRSLPWRGSGGRRAPSRRRRPRRSASTVVREKPLAPKHWPAASRMR